MPCSSNTVLNYSQVLKPKSKSAIAERFSSVKSPKLLSTFVAESKPA
jgi:hypothetical protein